MTVGRVSLLNKSQSESAHLHRSPHERADEASVPDVNKPLPTVAAAFEGDVRRQHALWWRAERVQAVQGVVPLVSAPALLRPTPALLSFAAPAVAETAVPDAAGFWAGSFVQSLRGGGGPKKKKKS